MNQIKPNGSNQRGATTAYRLLVALLFAFSLNSILAGIFQMRFGHPNRVLAGITLLLAGALAFAGYQVTQMGSG